jgi:hypothetical protein
MVNRPAELTAHRIDRRRDVHVGVGVHPAGHRQHLLHRHRICHHGHRRPFSHRF